MLNHNRPSAPTVKPDITTVDFEALPAKQGLIVDVLTARHRLGEPFWPIEVTLEKHLDALAALGVVMVCTDTPDYHRVNLTEAALKALIGDKTYRSPLEKERDDLIKRNAALKIAVKEAFATAG